MQIDREQWDIEKFNQVNLPVVFSFVDDREAFSDQTNPIRVLDMPVHMKEQGTRIPESIPDVFKNIIEEIIEFEEDIHGDMEEMYVYVTIDQKLVEAGKTGRRAGAHSDAYIERDQKQIDITHDTYDVVSRESGAISNTYVVSDCSPTEFFNAKFPLTTSDCESSLKTFDSIADVTEVVTYDNYKVLKLTPYVVHRSAVLSTDTFRTFMKVSVSNKKYAREGNTRNNLFDYNWDMQPRNDKSRNHPW